MIFALRVIDVSMMTVRVLLVARGARLIAPIMSFFEVLL